MMSAKGFVSLGILLISNLSFLWISFHLVKNFSDNEEDNNRSTSFYKYFEHDYIKNENSYGVVSLIDEQIQLENNGIIRTYIHDEDQHKEVLISPFGEEEYECFGSCYCEEESERKSLSQTQVTMTKGITTLVAAVSSTLAIALARQYLPDDCDDKLSKYCEGTIRYKIEECNRVFKTDLVDGVEKREYYCYGNCVENLREVKQRPSKTMDCKKLKMESLVMVYSDELLVKSQKQTISQRMRETARRMFQKDYLTQFCKEESKIEYVYIHPTGKISKKTGKERTFRENKSGYICSGKNSMRNKSPLRNVKCRQIDPLPLQRNSFWADDRWWKAKEKWDAY